MICLSSGECNPCSFLRPWQSCEVSWKAPKLRKAFLETRRRQKRVARPTQPSTQDVKMMAVKRTNLFSYRVYIFYRQFVSNGLSQSINCTSFMIDLCFYLVFYHKDQRTGNDSGKEEKYFYLKKFIKAFSNNFWLRNCVEISNVPSLTNKLQGNSSNYDHSLQTSVLNRLETISLLHLQ